MDRVAVLRPRSDSTCSNSSVGSALSASNELISLVGSGFTGIDLSNSPSPQISLAFSGGGIRSACFCVGVISELVRCNADIKKLSGVSGGCFAAIAYLNWKHHRECKKGKPQNIDKFEKGFRSNVGYLLNFDIWRYAADQKTKAGKLLRVLKNLALLLLVEIPILLVLMPSLWFLLWIASFVPMALPLAEALQNNFGSSVEIFVLAIACAVLALIFIALRLLCFSLFSPERNEWARALQDVCSGASALLVLLLVFMGFHELMKYLENEDHTSDIVSAAVVGCLFMLQAVPWLMGAVRLQNLIQVAIMVIAYAKISAYYKKEWTLEEETFWNVDFYIVRIVILALLAMQPWILFCLHRLVPNYFRWRLQNAFYKRPGACWGLSPFHHHFTFADLAMLKVKPHFICCTTVNDWKVDKNSTPYDLLTIEPHTDRETGAGKTKLTRYLIQHSNGPSKIEDVPPLNVAVSYAMANSGAVLAYSVGRISGKTVTALLNTIRLLGVGMGRNVQRYPYTRFRATHVGFLFWWCLFAGFLGAIWEPLVGYVLVLVVATLMIVHPVMMLFAWGRDFVSWIPHIQTFRSMLNLIEVHPQFPSQLHLSDGGHTENLGLYPLLESEDEHIISACGEADPKSRNPGLKYVIAMARERLGCRFYASDPRQWSNNRGNSSKPTIVGTTTTTMTAKTMGDETPSPSPNLITAADASHVVAIQIGDCPSSHQQQQQQQHRHHHQQQGEQQSQQVEQEPIVPEEDFDAIFKSEFENPKQQKKRVFKFFVLYRSGKVGEILYLKPSDQDQKKNWMQGRLMSLLFGKFPNHATWFQFFTPDLYDAYADQGKRAVHEAAEMYNR